MIRDPLGKRYISRLAAAALSLVSVCVLPVSTARGAVPLPPCAIGPEASRPADIYVPLDSWAYPALDRLRGLGYLDTAFLGLRPWTRRSIQRMLGEASSEEGIQANP